MTESKQRKKPLALDQVDADAIARLRREGLELRKKLHAELGPLTRVRENLLRLRLRRDDL